MSEAVLTAGMDLGQAPPDSGGSADALMARAGNHEAKLLLEIFLAQQEELLGSYRLGTGFRDFIGPGAAWYPGSTQPYRFCIDSLEPAGQVVRGEVPSHRGRSDGFGISDDGLRRGVPAAGLLGGWSLEHGGISVQQVFGPTQSSGSRTAAESRIAAMRTLLAAPGNDMATAEVAGVEPSEWRTPEYQRRLRLADQTCQALGRTGLVSMRREIMYSTRRFRIDDPEALRAAAGRDTPYMTAMGAFFAARVDEAQPEFSLEDAVNDVTARLEAAGETPDAAYIRRRIAASLSSYVTESGRQYRPFPGVERLEVQDVGSHTRLRLRPAYRAAVAALLDIVSDVASEDEDAMERGQGLADEIAASRSMKHRLIAKAYEHSSAARKKPLKETVKDVTAILQAAGKPLDLDGLLDAYGAMDTRPITKSSLALAMRAMTKAGTVRTTRERPRDSIRKRRNFYSLV